MTHPASDTDELLLAQCKFTFLRRSGPGGQHRNKTETAVIVEHVPSAIRAEANERRSQAENRRLAIIRLRLALATEVREPIAPDQSISSLWQSRIHKNRLSISEQHDDFPSILAEALDRIAEYDYQLDLAAAQLLVTSSQLVKLLKQHRPAFELVNRERQQRGFGNLK